MKQQEFSLKQRARSFRFAWDGIAAFFRLEHNARLHLLATLGVFLVAGLLKTDKTEWLALVFAIGFVWAAELFNTCIEKIMDFVSPKMHPEIRFIKDLSAAAVLVAALTALITACLVFIPKMISL